MTISRHEILSVIPHRPPFLFVSEISVCTKERAIGHHEFGSEDFLRGHFPEHPLVPGVILIEGLAQTLAYLALSQVSEQMVMLTGVDSCTIRNGVRPGDRVTYDVQIERTKLRMVIAKCAVTVAEKPILTARLKGYIGAPK